MRPQCAWFRSRLGTGIPRIQMVEPRVPSATIPSLFSRANEPATVGCLSPCQGRSCRAALRRRLGEVPSSLLLVVSAPPGGALVAPPVFALLPNGALPPKLKDELPDAPLGSLASPGLPLTLAPNALLKLDELPPNVLDLPAASSSPLTAWSLVFPAPSTGSLLFATGTDTLLIAVSSFPLSTA